MNKLFCGKPNNIRTLGLMVAVIAVRYVNSEVLRGGLGAKIYERAPEQCRDNKPSPVKEIFRHCPVR